MKNGNSKLYVFDLDFTLWDCGGTWVDHTHPPFRRKNGVLQDSRGRVLELYPDARAILKHLDSWGVTMAVASRTGEPDWAMELLHHFELDGFFKHMEIYPGSKRTHFRRLRDCTGVAYDDMVFFDDENINIEEVGSLGVQAVPVPSGIQWALLP